MDDLNKSADIPNAKSKPVDLEVLFATYGQQLIADLLTDYVLEADERMVQLADAINKKNIDAVNQYVHDLKGSSATIYATELADLSTSMEAYARGQDYTWDGMKTRFDEIEKAWVHARKYLADEGYCEPR